jgi:hypothetical protein
MGGFGQLLSCRNLPIVRRTSTAAQKSSIAEDFWAKIVKEPEAKTGRDLTGFGKTNSKQRFVKNT